METIFLFGGIIIAALFFRRLYPWFIAPASVEATFSSLGGAVSRSDTLLMDSFPELHAASEAYSKSAEEKRRYEGQRDRDLRQTLIQAKHAFSAELITGIGELAKQRAARTVEKYRYDAAVTQLQHAHDKNWRDTVDTAKRVYGVRPVERMLDHLDLGC